MESGSFNGIDLLAVLSGLGLVCYGLVRIWRRYVTPGLPERLSEAPQRKTAEPLSHINILSFYDQDASDR